MGVVNQVGTSFLPDKVSVASGATTLQTQRVTNSAPQPNNSFLFAEIAAPVTLNSGGAAEPFSWNVVSDSIVLGYPSPFSEISLTQGVWQTQMRVFCTTSDGSKFQLTALLPSNDYGGLSGTSLYSMSNNPLLFSEIVFVPDPILAKTLPYSITEILGLLVCDNGGAPATMEIDTATLIITRLH